MIRRLADRLVSVDLLDQAAELLQHQVDHRLQGAARAQVATRLAVVYLMNRKPDRALAALQATRVADLSNDLRDQRLLLEARAMSDIGRHDLALEVITNINSREAIRLRSDILWAAKRWREAGEQIELLYGERWREFAAAERYRTSRHSARGDRLCARRGNNRAWRACAKNTRAKLSDGPDRRAFEIVSAPIGTSGAEFQSCRQEGGERRYARCVPARSAHALSGSSAISPGGAAGNAPSAEPTPDKAKGPQTNAAPAGEATPMARQFAMQDPRRCRRKPPAGVPVKPDTEPTGSIPRLPRMSVAGAVVPIRWRLSAVALDQRSRDQAPAVDQHEEDQLERQ